MNHKQHGWDSFLEAVVNQLIGFIVAMATYVFIVNPLFNLQSSPAESFWITMIFTTVSIIRTFIIRRAFNGRSVYRYFAKD